MSKPELKQFRRIVVKVGSSLLVDAAKGEVRSSWLAALAADIAPIDDIRSTARYRLRVAQQVLAECLENATARAGGV